MAASGLLLQPSSPEDFRVAAAWHREDAIVRINKPIRIFIITFNEGIALTPIELLSSDTIASVKLRKNSPQGFFISQQKSVSRRQELTLDECLLKDYGVADDEVLRMVLRLSDLVGASIKTVNGDKHDFKAQRTSIITDLKRCVFRKDEEKLLSSRGKKLVDDAAIQDLPLGDFLLHLYVQQPARLSIKQVGEQSELFVGIFDLLKRNAFANSAKERGQSVRTGPVEKEIDLQSQASSWTKAFRRQSSIESTGLHQRFILPGSVEDLLERVRSGLQADQVPTLSSEGSGGVYFMKNEFGQNVAVFKPIDEEPMAVNNPRGFSSSNCCKEGLKRGTRVGGGALREVAAYLLDHPIHGPKRCTGIYQEGFAGVPITAMVRSYHEAFYWNAKDQRLYCAAKLGSLQQFVDAVSSCEDIGTSKLPVEEVHKITVLDLRLANADRNSGNILVCNGKDQSTKLVPIDHGYCLPEKFEDCTFEWLYWPQACHPYGSSVRKYIASLDAEEDIKLLKHYGINLRPESAQVLRVSTMVLKKGAAACLTPFQIGSIMSRQFQDIKSPIEALLEEAELSKPSSDEVDFLKILAELVDRYIARL